MSDPDLLLHLALDELQGDKLLDDSEGRHNAINHGAAIVENKEFGQCLELKGGADSYVQLGPLTDTMRGSQALTVMLWINPPEDKVPRLRSTTQIPNHCLLELANLYGVQTGAIGLSFCKVSSRELIASVYGGDFVTGSITPYHLDDLRLQAITSGWMHLTYVREQSGQQFYLNGLPFSTYQTKVIRTDPRAGNPLLPAPAASTWLFPPGVERGRPDSSFLGKSQIGVKEIGGPFVGRVAHLRVYKRALTQEQIKWHIEGDRTVQYRYRITHPIDFSLENRDADPTLFMDGHPDGQNMFLRVHNVTGGVVQLAELLSAEKASETNCHLELALRPGALATDSAAKVTVATSNNSWKIGSKSWAKPDDRDSLYLLCTKPGPLPDGGLTLELAHMLPDSRYGTRTTLVDFRYKNLKSGSLETISGSEQQNLDLVNHLGRRNIPLHVGFAGSNLVLNKSKEAIKLKLRVTNVLPRTDLYDDPHKAVGTGVLRFDDKSEFILSFDDLNAPEVIQEIVVRYAKGAVTSTPPPSPSAIRIGGTEGKPYQWKIPLKDLTLGPEEHLEILLENVKAAGSEGHSNLYLDYRDVPGYWNGRFTNVIEKAPLVYRNGKVGIGVEPETELHVKGTLKVDSLVVVNRPAMTVVGLKLSNGWRPKDANTMPRYFRDNQGMIHLTGHCVYQVEWVAGSERHFSPDLQIREDFRNRKGPFTLNDDCLPIEGHEFRFPGYVKCFFGSWGRSWHPLHISGAAVYPVLDLNQEYYEPAANYGNNPFIHIVEIYLDGISYPAKS